MSYMSEYQVEERIKEAAHILLEEYKKTGDSDSIIKNRDKVLSRYGKVFSQSNISNLSWDDFRGFLDFNNNSHWRGIYRQSKRLKPNFETVRKAIEELLDERQDIIKRINDVYKIKGIKKATTTPILLVAYPDKYGVWNEISEFCLKTLGIWPVTYNDSSKENLSLGAVYKNVNEVLLKLAKEMKVDLWTLDAIFWYYKRSREGEISAKEIILQGSESNQYSGENSSISPTPEFLKFRNGVQIIKEEAPSFNSKTPQVDGSQKGPHKFQDTNSEIENKELGDAGEELVLKYEMEKLKNHPDLLKKIKHISKEDDTAGYDILSYKKNGDELYIEVKTTRGGKETPFYLSANEYETWENNISKYVIYRLYEYNPSSGAKIYKLSGDLELYKPKAYIYIFSPSRI